MVQTRRLLVALLAGAAFVASSCSSSPSGPTTVTLTGTVIDSNSVPLSGQTVIITSGTFTKNAVSDSTGSFSVANVPTPYDATVIDTGGESVVAYVGLTRADPTLTDLANTTTSQMATLSGVFTGGTFPEIAGIATQLVFVSPQVTYSFSDLGDGTFSSTSNPIQWLGPSTTTGSLYALQVHAVADLPADFPGYGSLGPISLQNGESLTGQTMALAPVTAGNISGTISAPTGYPVTQKIAGLMPAPGVLLGFLSDSSASASFTYTTPSVPDTSIFFEVAAQGVAEDGTVLKKSLSANASGLTLTIPPPPMQSLPVSGASTVTAATSFSWTSYPGYFIFLVSPVGTGPTFAVITAATTATIPDTSAAGIPLPASTAYTWQTYALGPSTSVDAAAASGGLLTALQISEGYYSITTVRPFTTGP
jgi:hypothetical protein